MKPLIIILLISIHSFAQDKYMTKTGKVDFEASVPSFEEVSAKNNSVTAIINVDNGEIAALAMVTAFRFKNALMEEHFNENYSESHNFPKATFRGTIQNFSLENLSATKSIHKINGQLTFHGTTKEINCTASISRMQNHIQMDGGFKVLASDFKIDVPKIVSNKIAEDISVSFSFELKNTQ